MGDQYSYYVEIIDRKESMKKLQNEYLLEFYAQKLVGLALLHQKIGSRTELENTS